MTEQNNPALLGFNAYQKKLYGATSKEQVFLSLNKGIHEFLRAAKFSYEQDSLDKMCHYCQKSLQVILALKSQFARVDAHKNEAILHSFYEFLFKKNVSIQNVSDKQREFDSLLSTIHGFYTLLEDQITPPGEGKNLPMRTNTVI